MSSKYLVFIAFVVVALAQLYVPAKMILEREEVLNEGKEYKFKTAPIDPNDPFRGKYIVLSFQESTVVLEDEADWKMGESVFLSLIEDKDGFARPLSASKEKPVGDQEYLQATVSYVLGDSLNRMEIIYPFDRYYMEESKAYDAELAYRDSQMDSSSVTYALVSIKNGNAVLKDVLINGVPIREIVIAQQEKVN